MKKVFVSEEAREELKNYLKSKGYAVIEIKKTERVYPAIASHPDIYLCQVKEDLVIEPLQYQLIQKQLGDLGEVCSLGKSNLEAEYPGTIPYNAVVVGDYFIHPIRHTDPVILERVRKHHLTMIDVQQGYTQCNVVLVDEHSLITSDLGIAEALKDTSIQVLLITKGQVQLTGFPYGFLGGASGKIGNEIIFNGNLEEHKDFLSIKSFIEARKMTIKYFKEYPLEDIGSILAIEPH